MSNRKILVATIAACGALWCSCAQAGVTYLGKASINGKGADASGLIDFLQDGSRDFGLDGFGSGIAHTGFGNRYVMLADSGPSKSHSGGAAVDDSTSYKTRYQIFDINVSQNVDLSWNVAPTLFGTTLFKNEAGQNLIGLSSAFVGATPYGVSPNNGFSATDLTKHPELNLRFDPESVRVAPDGTLYVSDEYGPSIYHFDQTGKRIGVLNVPDKFKVSKLDSVGSNEDTANSGLGGRLSGKGLEGLAITPDGTKLLATMQGALFQDGGNNGKLDRFILFDLTNPNATPKEFLYTLDTDPSKPSKSNTGVSDAVAINNHQFLIDERDGSDQVSKYGYVIDIDNAVDVSGISALTSTSPSLSKTRLLDLKALVGTALDSVATGYTAGFPDKIEGFAFGPDLPDGRHLLLVSNDNGYVSTGSLQNTYPNYILAFAVDSASMPGFQAETFVPEPGGLAFIGAVGMMVLRRRRKSG